MAVAGTGKPNKAGRQRQTYIDKRNFTAERSLCFCIRVSK